MSAMKFKGSGRELILRDGQEAKHLAEIISADGFDDASGESYTWTEIVDTITLPDLGQLMEPTVEFLLREPLDPIMNILPLFTRASVKSLDSKVVHGAIGHNIVAQKYGELSTLPEQSIQMGGGFQVATIDKYGVQVSFSNEVLRYTTFPIMNYNLKCMTNALGKLKEEQAVSMFRSMGNPLFDNLNPTASHFGALTGRGIDLARNGSMTVDDLFKAMVYMIEEGFTPTALVMSPMAFLMYTQDPVFRNLFLLGQGGSYFNMFTGNAGPTDPWSNGSTGSQGPSLGNKIVPSGNASGATATGIAGREHGMTSTAPFPQSYFPWSLKIIVSPFIAYDADTELGDIYLVSEGNVGLYLEEQSPTRTEWRNDELEKVTIRISERYTFAVSNDGQGVGVFKNVKFARNYWDGFVRVQHTAALAEIPADESPL